MNALPADVIERTAADEHPATLDVDQPCPDDIGAAVIALWQTVRDLTHRLAAIEAQGGRF
jgi:hypothetical protein